MSHSDVLSALGIFDAAADGFWDAAAVEPVAIASQELLAGLEIGDLQPVACSCPLCAGRVVIQDEGEAAGPQFWSQGGYDRGGGSGGESGKPSYTIDQAAAQLTRGSNGWGFGHQLGTPVTVTYAYRSTEPTKMPQDTTGFSRFSAAQIAAAELAFAAWSDVAGITFARVTGGLAGDSTYSNDASILLGNYSSGQSGAAAFAYFPGNTAATAVSGDIWVNNSQSSNAFPVLWQYGYQVLTHEIGHAIGILHPAEYNASETSNPTYENSALYYEDSRQYSLMSYFGSSNTGASLPGFAAAPQLDDIAAAQRLYGANMSTRTGDTTYGFNSNADRPWFNAGAGVVPVFAVWDAGGTDTFDFSGYGQNQTIDLRQGGFSSVGGYRYNVAVAKGAVIENAVGGSGADTLIGNAAANRLEGNAGADVLKGGAGADLLIGGAGADFLDGGTGRDHAIGEGFARVHKGVLYFGEDRAISVESFQQSGSSVVQQINYGAAVLLSGDANGDGRADLTWVSTNGAVSDWSMNGPSATVAIVGFTNSDWRMNAVGDFNGDGRADKLWRSDASGATSLWLSGSGGVQSVLTSGHAAWNWFLQGTGDFNADGKADLLWRNNDSGDLYVWLQDGAVTTGSYRLGGAGADWKTAGIADFNGDGRADVVWRNIDSGEVAVWATAADGRSTFSSFVLPAKAGVDAYDLAAVADFNGDGKADLLWRGLQTDDVFIWTMNADGTRAGELRFGAGQDWQVKAVGDFNGDGRADIVWQNATTNAVVEWQLGSTDAASGHVGFGGSDWLLAG